MPMAGHITRRAKNGACTEPEACIDIGDVKSGDSTMAETSKGKKFVKVKGYTRVVDGKKVKVGAFDRSTPKTSKGKKK
jgi:hypothetical protein